MSDNGRLIVSIVAIVGVLGLVVLIIAIQPAETKCLRCDVMRHVPATNCSVDIDCMEELKVVEATFCSDCPGHALTLTNERALQWEATARSCQYEQAEKAKAKVRCIVYETDLGGAAGGRDYLSKTWPNDDWWRFVWVRDIKAAGGKPLVFCIGTDWRKRS